MLGQLCANQPEGGVGVGVGEDWTRAKARDLEAEVVQPKDHGTMTPPHC